MPTSTCHTLQAILTAGRGKLPSRGTESGQLLLDLASHGDVVEWALWANSFSNSLYRAVWGDKDTYALAFAVAGKAHAFNQLQVVCVGRGCKSGVCNELAQPSN
jgi:hypothetical protein